MKILFTEITAALAETIIIYIYLNFFFPSDRSNKYQVKNLFYYGGFFILNFVFSIFIESPPLRMILLTVLMIILTVFVQKASLLPACCAAVIFSVLLVLFEFIGAIVLLSAGGESPRISLESPVLTIFTKLTEMTCISIIISFSKRNPFHLSFRSMLPLIAGNIFSLFICIQLWYSSFQTPPEKLYLLTFSIFGLLYINIILYVYLYYINLAHEVSNEKLIAEHQLELQLQYYETINEEQERTRSMWHDMRKQLNMITELMQSDQSKAVECLVDLDKQFMQLRQIVHFDNPIISSILNDALHQMRSNDIRIDFDVMTAAELQISPLTLSVVIGNTIENAVQACEQLEHIADAWIQIHIHQHGRLLHYIIENTYCPNNQSTAKKDTGIHGYGLKNVKKCVENNNGLYHISKTDDTFTVEITLNV